MGQEDPREVPLLRQRRATSSGCARRWPSRTARFGWGTSSGALGRSSSTRWSSTGSTGYRGSARVQEAHEKGTPQGESGGGAANARGRRVATHPRRRIRERKSKQGARMRKPARRRKRATSALQGRRRPVPGGRDERFPSEAGRRQPHPPACRTEACSSISFFPPPFPFLAHPDLRPDPVGGFACMNAPRHPACSLPSLGLRATPRENSVSLPGCIDLPEQRPVGLLQRSFAGRPSKVTEHAQGSLGGTHEVTSGVSGSSRCQTYTRRPCAGPRPILTGHYFWGL